MSLLKNLVPYEVRISALNISSGHSISNVLYYRDTTDHGGGYAADIAGSDDAVFEASVFSMWTGLAGSPAVWLNNQYQMTGIRVRSIIGWGYPTPLHTITAVASGLTDTHVVTASPHSLSVGDVIRIFGVTTPNNLNGNWVVASVPSTTEITVTVVTAGPYSGVGQLQLNSGTPDIVYGSNLEVTHSFVGGVAGDQIPLFATISMRRLNAGIGKSYRSRLSLSPLSETDQNNGRLTVAALAQWVTVGGVMTAPQSGGGAASMDPIAFSKLLALASPSPFTQADSFTQEVTSHAPRTNLGSLIKRKPRLTSAITP